LRYHHAVPDDIRVQIVAFNSGENPHHVVEVEHGGVTRRVAVYVDDQAWTGLGWFGSPHDGIETIVLRYVEIQARAGTLKDKEFVTSDEGADLYWGRK